VADDLELMAVVSVAQTLLHCCLTTLTVNITRLAAVTPVGLVHIARLSGLQQLHVRLVDRYPMDGLLCHQHESFVFLGALKGIKDVQISSTSAYKQQVLQAAGQRLLESKLPAPACITISLITA
jgi:hypothetical protein